MTRKTNKIPDPELYQKIIKNYSEIGSIKKVSINCSVSEVTVRRVLITEGLWSSKTSLKVTELYNLGKSVSEIASALSVTEKAVQAYLPYTRGMYGVTQTDSAEYSKNYRNRISQAQKAVSNLTGKFDESRIQNISEDNLSQNEDSEEDDDMSSSAYGTTAMEGEENNDIQFKGNGTIYKLHLQLTAYDFNDYNDNLGLSKKHKDLLFKLAKVKKSISRDVLVPGNMNLHALSYAIMKVFGWQNSHLHNFALSKEDFNKVTSNGNIGDYFDLCGVLFRFVADVSDAYWDDDYQENISFKSWIKRKYSAPFRNGSVGDSWLGNLWDIYKFDERFPEYDPDGTLEEVMNSMDLGQDPNYLIERLSVDQVLLPKSGRRSNLKTWKNDINNKTILLDESLEDMGIDLDEMQEASEELMLWRESVDNLDKIKWQFPDAYEEEVEERTGQPYDEVVYTNYKELKYWERKCKKVINDWNIIPEPYFHEIYYLYDYGDGWAVRITVEDTYHRRGNNSDNLFYYDYANYPVNEDLSDQLFSIDTKGRPICVAADGLDLVDDCGGIHGYLDMLQTIHGANKREAKEMLDWARSLGWTGKMIQPEKML